MEIFQPIKLPTAFVFTAVTKRYLREDKIVTSARSPSDGLLLQRIEKRTVQKTVSKENAN